MELIEIYEHNLMMIGMGITAGIVFALFFDILKTK